MPDTVVANPGSSGAIFATDVVTSSVNYVLQKIAYGSTGVANLVSSSLPFPVASASSGLVQVSGNPTVIIGTTAGTAINTSSAIGLPYYAAVTPTSSVAGASIGPVTSSAGVLATISSGTVSLSSQITVTATGPVTISGTVTVLSASSGLVQISGTPTVTATAGTNPWSSAPIFNIPIVSVSSGLLQVSAIQVSPTSSVAGAGLLVVTSSFGMVTQSTQPVTITSGTVTLSSAPTVTATAATNPWSSAPGFNIPVVTVSSGLVQISGTPTINITGTQNVAVVTVTSGAFASGLYVFSTAGGGGAGSTAVNLTVTPTSSIAGAGMAPVTSSAGLLTNLSSGTVSLSSQITVTATGPVTVTSGLISVTSGTITSTAATNPWSSAPGFNIPTVSVSSGLSQLSAIQVSPTSSIAGAGLVVMTSSAGVMANLSSGTVSLSSQITVTATGPVTVTSGTITLSSVHTVTATAATNPWSSAPGFNVPVVSVSSGLIQLSSQITVTATGPVTITSGTVTATAATNPWSSAPAFNIPVVNVSSGFIQSIDIASVTSPAILSTWFQSTGGAASVLVNSSPGNFRGYALFNSTAAIRSVKIFNTSVAPTIGSTVNILTILEAPGSTGGGGANMMLPAPGVFASLGLGFTMTANIGATDTGAPGLNDLTLTLYFV